MAKRKSPGHKDNSVLNGEWGGHVRADGKKITAGKRRIRDKKIIREEVEFINGVDPHIKGKKADPSKRVWVKEYKWRSKKLFDNVRKFWREKYSEDWQQDTWGKFKSPKMIRDSILSELRNSFWRENAEAKEWRARNIKTGEIIEFPHIHNYYQ